MHFPGRVWRSTRTRIAGRFRWVDDYFAYLVEVFAAGFILVLVLLQVLTTLTNRDSLALWWEWLRICLWALSPTTRFGIGPFPVWLFWVMFVALLIFIALPPAALYLARDSLTRIMMWSEDPNRQALSALHRERARLAFLRLRAQEEHEQLYYWKHRRFVDPSEPLVLSKYASPSSFSYVTLSNYLRLPLEPVAELGLRESPELLAPQAASEVQSLQSAGERHQVQAPYAVLLLSAVRFRIGGIMVPIDSIRAREVLAYLAVPARKNDCTKDDIIHDVHEEHLIEKEDEETLFSGKDYRQKGRDAFAYDVKLLRRLLEETCPKNGLPYVDPVAADKGAGAFHRLAKEYVVEDLSRLEQLAERLALLKQEAEPPADLETFRAEYKAVLSLYR